MRSAYALAAVYMLVVACGGEEQNAPVAAPPPVTPVPSAPSPPIAVPASPEEAGTAENTPVDAQAAPPPPPLTAQFVELSAKATAPVQMDPCGGALVSVASGDASALGVSLKKGDTLIAGGPGGFDVKGKGVVLVAIVAPPTGPCSNAAAVISKKVVRAKAAPTLAWGGGAFKAHLDLDGEPTVYLGRLEGTGAVPEHTHPTSWEFLCAVEASGTFALDGVPQHLGPRGIVSVPPGTKHSWQPDAGSKLVAIQLYAPPGPEQRFKALAAAAKDAGADGAQTK